MSIQAPDDTEKVLNNLIEGSNRVLKYAPLHVKLLLQGALIDAKALLSEIRGEEQIDTHAEALKVIREEMRKAAQS